MGLERKVSAQSSCMAPPTLPSQWLPLIANQRQRRRSTRPPSKQCQAVRTCRVVYWWCRHSSQHEQRPLRPVSEGH